MGNRASPGRFTVLLLLFGMLAGCGGAHVHKDEEFRLESPYRKQFDVSSDLVCQCAKRALLSQGYTLGDNFPDSVKAHKEFQKKDATMTVLEFSVICMPGRKGSILFANAVESIYEVKKNRDSVGVGVSSLGSIKLPWGERVDSLVKTSGETIDDKRFYNRFFSLVENIIKDTREDNR